MGNYQSIFKRYEKKYLLNTIEYIRLKKDLDKYMLEDEYGLYTICNLYFDTDNYEIIRRSIEKPIYKEKLRVRSYGVPKEKDKVFFELKKKYKKEVFKRRISLTLDEFNNYLTNGTMPNASKQIMSEIEWFKKMYQLYPRIYIAYDRRALYGKDNPQVRVTFDQNIRFRNDNLCLSKGDYGTNILDFGEYIMEIKVEGAMPSWLSSILAKNKILPISFSKYGVCYKNYLLKEKTPIPRKEMII